MDALQLLKTPKYDLLQFFNVSLFLIMNYIEVINAFASVLF